MKKEYNTPVTAVVDMFETACNVAGDNIGTYVVGKKMKLLEE